jgi:hypothetical protein
MIFVILAVFNFLLEEGLYRVVLALRKPLHKKMAGGALTLRETVNTCWLLYITLAETFGVYESCDWYAYTLSLCPSTTLVG